MNKLVLEKKNNLKTLIKSLSPNSKINPKLIFKEINQYNKKNSKISKNNPN